MTDDDIIAGVLEAEGGFVDHPADRGGPTRFGITAATLGQARRLGRAATRTEVRELGREEAREIYRRLYLTQPGFGRVADMELRRVLVDSAVLFGPDRAVRWLQQAVGAAVDGEIGPETLVALDRGGAARVRLKVIGLRVRRLAEIVVADASQLAFLKGWIARTADLLEA